MSQPHRRVVGLDIGGASLKVATSDGEARQHPFALWQQLDALPDQLRDITAAFQPVDLCAVTMTGELADCFLNKRDGVQHIVNAVTAVFGENIPHFFQVGGEFVAAGSAVASWQRTAASNWFALTTFAASEFQIPAGILVDIGSTTTDMIPIVDRSVASSAITDLDRLKRSELLYCGVSRTSVDSVLSDVDLIDPGSQERHRIRIAAERFATMADVFVILGDRVESPMDSNSTADNRPLTREFSLSRLARCLCSDLNEVTEMQLVDIAQQVREYFFDRVRCHLNRVVQTVAAQSSTREDELTVVISGEGESAARMILADLGLLQNCVSIEASWGSQVSRCAPAFAVARMLAARYQP